MSSLKSPDFVFYYYCGSTLIVFVNRHPVFVSTGRRLKKNTITFFSFLDFKYDLSFLYKGVDKII